MYVVKFKTLPVWNRQGNLQGVNIMKMKKMYHIPLLMLFLLFGSVLSSEAAVDIQCPCDNNGDGDCTDGGETAGNVTCLHLGAGDGGNDRRSARDVEGGVEDDVRWCMDPDFHLSFHRLSLRWFELIRRTIRRIIRAVTVTNKCL